MAAVPPPDDTAGLGAASNKPTNQVWKNPSAAHQQKYFVHPLPDDFEPTEEESGLLGFYETIRNYERQAARLKDAAARARLAAKDEEFQKTQKARGEDDGDGSDGGEGDGTGEPPNKKRRKKKKPKKKPMASALDDDGEMDSDDDDDDEENEDDDEDDSEEEDEAGNAKSSFDRREAKLKKLRDEVEAKMSSAVAAEKAEEAKRRELLAEAVDDEEDGPTLTRRKRLDSDAADTKPKSSLIANLENTKTPPHDFSSTLHLTAIQGQKLFPPPDLVSWAPSKDASSPDDRALTLELDKFDVTQAQNASGNNTVAIKFMAPEDSKRFSINIAGPDHDNFHSVLFHFNPRHYERGGQLVLNNKQEGMWGQAINVPLSQVPLIFGQPSCTLIIQINGEGFDVFLNDDKNHIARLEHRRELSSGQISLFLNFPSTDDYNKPENWVVYKVWWGNKPAMAKQDLSSVPGYKSFNSLHPRKLFISKLKKIRTDPEVDLRRAELERAFRKYGGARGVTVLVPKNQTFAFVEMESERQADLALQQMASHYRINRARRTRHEALQEERLAAEAKKAGKKKEGTDWD